MAPSLNDLPRRLHFWQGVAGLAFSLWALLVPLSAKWVVDSISNLTEAEANRARIDAQRNEITEARLTKAETRIEFILDEIQSIRRDHATLREKEH